MGSRETARSLGLRKMRRSSRRLKPIERTRHPRFEPLECRHVLSAVVGTFLFYDNSHFDGGVTGINPADSAAISDRSAYRPNGTTAISSAVSSYTRGINGIMIDLSAGGSHAAIDASDFVFTIGNTNSPGGWTAAPTPSAVSVSIGGGVGNSDRVEITWSSGSMTNKWLEVQVLGTAHTGLASTDLFFWGNRIADSGSSPPANNFQTDSTDAAQVFATLTPHDGASVTNLRDYNRSGTVDSTDAAIVFASLGVITRLNLTLAPPALTAGLTDDTAPDGMQNTDTITSDATIGGTLNGSAPISSFTGWLNADAPPTDLTSLLQLDGSFTIDPSQLASMHGVGLLADGVYVLHLRERCERNDLGRRRAVHVENDRGAAGFAGPDRCQRHRRQ